MIHDLVIRIITKYLYGNNQTLANLHLVSRRFYKIREMFVKEIANVIVKILEIPHERFDERIEEIVEFIFISPTSHYIHHIVNLKYFFNKTQWIDWRQNVLNDKNKYISFAYKEGSHQNYRCNYRCKGSSFLLRSAYVKSFANCLSVVIDDPRCWRD